MKTGSCFHVLRRVAVLLLIIQGCCYEQVPVSSKSIQDPINKYFIIHQQQFLWWLANPIIGEDTIQGIIQSTSLIKKYEKKWVHIYINSDVLIENDSFNPLVIIPVQNIISVEANMPDKKANVGVGLGTVGLVLLVLTFLPYVL